MEYKIEINDNYYIKVDKKLDTSTMTNEPYVGVGVVIIHKKYNKEEFPPVILVDCVYKKKWTDKFLGTNWKKRVANAEMKLIEKAIKQIENFPNIEETLFDRIDIGSK